MKVSEPPVASSGSKIRFTLENLDDVAQFQQMAQGNISRRFKINLRAVSQSSKNKLSTRFQDIDRLFVCRKTKEQRGQMGAEYDGVKLTDIYNKANPNKIAQKYGKSIIV